MATMFVAILAVSACGSSDSGDSSRSPKQSTILDADQAKAEVNEVLGAIPAVSGETTRGIEGRVITIGGTGSATRGGQDTLPGLDVGAKARIERANREGGVNGYTFNYVGFEDDHATPNESLQAVQSLVKSDKVFALVPYAALAGSSSDYLLKEKVPSFGWLTQDFCTWDKNPYMFSTTGQTNCANPLPGKAVGVTGPLQSYIDETGKKPADVKLAVYGANDPSSKAGLNGLAAAGEALGMDVVYAQTDLPSAVEPQLSDYTPIAQKLVSSGANLIVGTTVVPTTLAVLGALKGLGYQGDSFAGIPIEALLQSPQTAAIVDGVYAGVGATGGIPLLAPEEFNQVQDDLDAIGSDAPAEGIGTVTGYWAADLFLQALAAVDGPVTAEKVTNVLNDGSFQYTGIEGVTCSNTYPVGRVLPSLCAGLLKYDAAGKTLDALTEYKALGGYAIVDAK
ncbi:ABC transporter substrate-binding protein [Nocardioides marmoriginsengisoli]|nr:ABC transporter substrate-binding protein [Nocardioides marmoriginsengisoli]